MYFLALAVDYDGTLARNGVVSPDTVNALRTLKDTGRRLILVTGRELADIRHLCTDFNIFDRIVAENGALTYDPASGHESLVAAPPSRAFVDALKARNVAPLSVGRSIVATWVPHQGAVLDVIRELQLELQIVFNKGAVMVLPTGVNKATGLLAALRDLDISRHNVVAVGDAENDHAFLRACGCSAAVANALPSVKAEVDIVLDADHGAGVVELVQKLMDGDSRLGSKAYHGILIGTERSGTELHIEPYGGSILIAGSPKCGKSTFATALTERMAEKGFEFCVIDPEGDYHGLSHCVEIGDARRPPRIADALTLLNDAGVNLVLHTQCLTMKDRRELFSALMVQTGHLRAKTGRPHWLLIDEAHQVLSAARAQSWHHLGDDIPAAILVTAFPKLLAAEALKTISTAIILGDTPKSTIDDIALVLGVEAPGNLAELEPGEAMFWDIGSGKPPIPMHPALPLQPHHRHAGKYAIGDVGREHSFYFRGPQRALSIGASNLYNFLDVACSVDDATWEHHLRAGDYSAWFRNVIGDEELATATEAVERDLRLDPQRSRTRIRQAVWHRYAAPGWSS